MTEEELATIYLSIGNAIADLEAAMRKDEQGPEAYSHCYGAAVKVCGDLWNLIAPAPA